jgi:aspartate racemase
MKTIGMLGGMSWESTVPYYQQINRIIGERLGGLHSAKILLYSVDFYEVEELMRAARWDEAGDLLADAAARLESGGADFLVLCTNTLHKIAPAIEARVRIPLLHIVDPTAREIQRRGLRRAGLLGTRYTMEESFYRDRLADLHGIDAFVPGADEREVVQRIIFTELCLGKTLEPSRLELRRIAEGLVARGAEAVILGCTELAMLLADGDLKAPVLDGTALHAHEAALLAIEDELKAQQDVTPSTVR